METTSINKDFELLSTKRQIVGPREFLEILQKTPIHKIKRTKYLRPKLGSMSFGKYLIEYEF